MSDLVPVAEQRARILDALAPLPSNEVALEQAHGHRLAGDVHARLAVPPWDNSAMDGYAVRFQDVSEAGARPATLDVVADIPAGSALNPRLQPGQAARIMTGAVLPTSADTVVQMEHTDRTDPHGELAPTVTVGKAQLAGSHIRTAGEDVGVGDLIATGGTYVNATVLAALAASGNDPVQVYPRARLAVVATGSELVKPGQNPRRGQIPDSNTLLVSALARQGGAEVVSAGAVGDDPAALAEHLDWLTTLADVIVLTGGVSAGAYDPLTRVFKDSDDVAFTKVSMQPGKPQAFGRYRDVWLFGLPGNPVSAWVSFHVFVRPALARLHGTPAGQVVPTPVLARAGTGWSTPPVRDQYLPIRIGYNEDRSGYVVHPAAERGSQSHLVASLARAEGYAIVPGHIDRVEPGDTVQVVIEPGGQP